MHIYHALAAAEEPLYPAQPVGQQWHLADLHGLATGRGVRIAVIDSGIAAGHPDLAGQLQRNENFVDGRPLVGESHGTAVAGIIAARADNGRGIAGVAPQARLLGLRACWQAPSAETLCTSFSLARALVAAVQSDAQIINMSLAGPEDKLLAVLVDQALARGMLVVAALAPGPDNFPASRPGVLAVGAAAPIPPGAVLAPGRDVPSTAPGGGWSLVSGSSFSAAHVSGLLALMRELDLGAQRGTIRTALVTEPAGRIDACATLLQQTHTRRTACAQTALGHTSD
jgi:subtilisin family serine protease